MVRKFEQSVARGCLGSGVYTDFSSSSGNVPEAYIVLNRSVNLLVPKSSRNLSISVVIPSSPGAFPSCELLIAFSTSAFKMGGPLSLLGSGRGVVHPQRDHRYILTICSGPSLSQKSFLPLCSLYSHQPSCSSFSLQIL